jgi:hypothetical protein
MKFSLSRSVSALCFVRVGAEDSLASSAATASRLALSERAAVEPLSELMDMLDLLKRMVGNNSTIRLVDTGICRIRLFRETSLNLGRAVRIARLLPINVRLYWNGAVGEPNFPNYHARQF